MRNTAILFWAILIALFSSCISKRYIYSASPPNNPYFTKKAQSQLTGSYSVSASSSDDGADGQANGFDLQGAIAVSDHWAVTAGYFNRREKDIYQYYNINSPFDTSVVKYKRKLFDIGGGYFYSLNPQKTIVLNLFGGVGFGTFSFDDNGKMNNTAYSRFHSSNVTRFFFQPAVNFTTGNYFRCAVILRSSFVHYGSIQTSYTANELQSFSLEQLYYKTFYFFEPAVNFQFGIPNIKWMRFDLGFSAAPYSQEDILGVRTGNTSIGLSFQHSGIRSLEFT